MKIKLLIAAAVIGFIFISRDAWCQTKQPSPVIIQQTEATQIVANIQKGMQLIHHLDVPALKRDSLDLLFGQVAQFIYDRNQLALKSDTAKKVTQIKK
jgi:hypothetical protein